MVVSGSGRKRRRSSRSRRALPARGPADDDARRSMAAAPHAGLLFTTSFHPPQTKMIKSAQFRNKYQMLAYVVNYIRLALLFPEPKELV
jgi:hypothetical protein